MARLTLIAFGTRGDTQPATALGRGLKEAGHAVRIVAGQSYAGWIERHGLEAAPSRVDVQALMEGERGREWVRQGNNPLVQRRLMTRLFTDAGRQLVEDAWAAVQGADAVISSFTSDTYAMAFAEKLKIPQISIPLQPLTPTKDGRALPAAPVPGGTSPLNLWFARLFLERFGWQVSGAVVNRFRREVLALPEWSATDFARARRLVPSLHAFSRHVVPRPDDWPANHHITGYFFLDEHPEWRPPDPLARFLASGPAPVYLGFGSMTGEDGEVTTGVLLEAVALAGCRAVLAAGWAGLGSDDLPETVMPIEAAPHEHLLPLMAAAVHHGGAGTTAAALRAGVPSIVVPHMSDQPFWGRRVAALGAGPRPIPRPKLNASRLAEAIRQVMTDEPMRARAAALGTRIAAEDAVGTATRLIAELLNQSGSCAGRPTSSRRR